MILLPLMLSFSTAPIQSQVEQTHILWQIGSPDQGTSQFALGPKSYREYKLDPLYIVGQSTAKDMPYVLPGPADQWAGGTPHSDTIVFGLKSLPKSGTVSFQAMFHDSQSVIPPQLILTVNGHKITQWQAPAGGGDDSLDGSMAHARPVEFDAAIPVSELQTGDNSLELTNGQGSWMILRSLSLKAPEGAALAPVVPSLRLTSLPQPQVVLRTPSGLKQELDFKAMRIGGSLSGTWTVTTAEGTSETPAQIPAGTSTARVMIPKLTKEEQVQVSFQSSEGASGFSFAVRPVREWTIYLMPHAHLDVGYTNTQAQVSEIQRHNLQNAMQVHRQAPKGIDYHYSFEGTWILDQLLQHGSKAAIQNAKEGLQAGVLYDSAEYANELTALMRPEEMMASYRLGQIIGQKFGVKFDVASQTDVPGMTWGDVTAMNASGVKAMLLMPNPSDRIGDVIRDWQDKPFWWVSPDGKSKVLLWETVTYGMAHGLHRFNGDRKDIFHDKDPDAHFVGPYLMPRLQQLAQQGYPYRIIAIPWSVTDNSPVDGDVPGQVRDWNAKYAVPRIEIKSFSGAVHGLLQEYGTTLPTHRGDLSPYWEDGAGSTAKETSMNRWSADRLVQAEALNAMRKPELNLSQQIMRAWSNVVLFSEHTWGSWDSVSNPTDPFTKQVWAGKKAFADSADQESRSLLQTGLSGPRRKDPALFDVWNTQSWPRSGAVTLHPANSSKYHGAVDAQTGRPLLVQPGSDGSLTVWAEIVPAFGAERIRLTAGRHPVPSAVKASGTTLENKYIRVTLDPKTGAVKSLMDKSTGRNLVDDSKTELNQYYYLLGGDASKVQPNSNCQFQVKSTGPMMAEIDVRSSAPGTKGLVQKYRLYANSSRLQIEDVLDKTPVLDKESVHIAFPLRVPNGQMRISGPWSVIRPEKDQLPGANRNWLCTQRFVDVSNQSFGVTVTSEDAPLVEVGGITATVMGGGYLSSDWIHRLPQTQTFYSWALNNIWYTNYMAEQSGPLVFRYQVAPHKAVSPTAWAKAGIEATQPLLASPASGPVYHPSLAVSGKGVIVTLFKRADDGKGWIVRLWGASGKTEPATVRWLKGRSMMWVSSVAEDRRERIQGGRTVVPGWGQVTIRIAAP